MIENEHGESFLERLNGRFDGMIRVETLEPLGAAVALHDDWHLVAPDGEEKTRRINGQEARQTLERMVAEILEEERGVWTTMVYAQSLEEPWIIKVFHPRRAGCGCGEGGGIIPWRVFSRVTPEPVPGWGGKASCDLPAAESSAKAGGSWFSRIFS